MLGLDGGEVSIVVLLGVIVLDRDLREAAKYSEWQLFGWSLNQSLLQRR